MTGPPGAFTQIVCTVIRSHLRDAIRFWFGKEVPLQPRLWLDPVGITMRGAAFRFTTRIYGNGSFL